MRLGILLTPLSLWISGPLISALSSDALNTKVNN